VANEHPEERQMTTLLASPTPQVASRAFLRFAERLKLTIAEQATLLGVKPRTMDRIRAGEATIWNRNELERLSHLVNIWEEAATFFGTAGGGVEWLTNANMDFGDRRPLDVMLGGQVADLLEVRRYLETALQGF